LGVPFNKEEAQSLFFIAVQKTLTNP